MIYVIKIYGYKLWFDYVFIILILNEVG